MFIEVHGRPTRCNAVGFFLSYNHDLAKIIHWYIDLSVLNFVLIVILFHLVFVFLQYRFTPTRADFKELVDYSPKKKTSKETTSPFLITLK